MRLNTKFIIETMNKPTSAEAHTIEKPLKLGWSDEGHYTVNKPEVYTPLLLVSHSIAVELQAENERLKQIASDLECAYSVNKNTAIRLSEQLEEQKKLSASLAEALEKIVNVKRSHEKEDYKYPYNRCWNIAVDALAKYNESINSNKKEG